MNKENNVILISDGLNNTGKYNAYFKYKNPIHTLGIGNNSALENDIEIQRNTFDQEKRLKETKGEDVQ